MRIVFLTDDLVFPSRVAGVAQKLGARMETALSADAALAKIESGEDCVVLIDLNSSSAVPGALVPKLNGLAKPPKAIVAFGPHVHEAKLAAAREAGCDVVLTRGQFDAQMDELLQRLVLGERE